MELNKIILNTNYMEYHTIDSILNKAYITKQKLKDTTIYNEKDDTINIYKNLLTLNSNTLMRIEDNEFTYIISKKARELKAYLDELISNCYPKWLVKIRGPSGIGKSSFLAFYSYTLRIRDELVFYYEFGNNPIDQMDIFFAFLDSFSQVITYDDYDDLIKIFNNSDYICDMLKRLIIYARRCTKRNIIIILDGVNNLTQPLLDKIYSIANFVHLLICCYTNSFDLEMTNIIEHYQKDNDIIQLNSLLKMKTDDSDIQMFNNEHKIKKIEFEFLHFLDDREINNLVELRLGKIGFDLDNKYLEHKIIEITKSNPLLIHQFFGIKVKDENSIKAEVFRDELVSIYRKKIKQFIDKKVMIKNNEIQLIDFIMNLQKYILFGSPFVITSDEYDRYSQVIDYRFFVLVKSNSSYEVISPYPFILDIYNSFLQSLPNFSINKLNSIFNSNDNQALKGIIFEQIFIKHIYNNIGGSISLKDNTNKLKIGRLVETTTITGTNYDKDFSTYFNDININIENTWIIPCLKNEAIADIYLLKKQQNNYTLVMYQITISSRHKMGEKDLNVETIEIIKNNFKRANIIINQFEFYWIVPDDKSIINVYKSRVSKFESGIISMNHTNTIELDLILHSDNFNDRLNDQLHGSSTKLVFNTNWSKYNEKLSSNSQSTICISSNKQSYGFISNKNKGSSNSRIITPIKSLSGRQPKPKSNQSLSKSTDFIGYKSIVDMFQINHIKSDKTGKDETFLNRKRK